MRFKSFDGYLMKKVGKLVKLPHEKKNLSKIDNFLDTVFSFQFKNAAKKHQTFDYSLCCFSPLRVTKTQPEGRRSLNRIQFL